MTFLPTLVTVTLAPDAGMRYVPDQTLLEARVLTAVHPPIILNFFHG